MELKLFFFKQKTAYEIHLSLVGSVMCIGGRSLTLDDANRAQPAATVLIDSSVKEQDVTLSEVSEVQPAATALIDSSVLSLILI